MTSCFPRPPGSTFVLVLLAAAFAVPAQGQVVIEERAAPMPLIMAAPDAANRVAAPSTFTPTISGTLRIRYVSLNEGRYFSYSYIDLTTHSLGISFNGQTTTDPLAGRFAFRRRTIGTYGFRGVFTDSYYLQTQPSFIYTFSTRTEGIDSYTATPTVNLGEVQAGVPFTLGMNYVEPAGGAYDVTLTQSSATATSYALRGQYFEDYSPLGTPTRQITVVAEIVPSDTPRLSVALSPAVLRPGQEGVVSVSVTAPVTALTDEDEVDLALGEVASEMGGLVVEGASESPVRTLRVRLGDLRAGRVRYRILPAVLEGSPARPAATEGPARRNNGISSGSVLSSGAAEGMASLAPPTPPSNEPGSGAEAFREISGIPVELSASLVRIPSIRGNDLPPFSVPAAAVVLAPD